MHDHTAIGLLVITGLLSVLALVVARREGQSWETTLALGLPGIVYSAMWLIAIFGRFKIQCCNPILAIGTTTILGLWSLGFTRSLKEHQARREPLLTTQAATMGPPPAGRRQGR